MMQKKAHEQPIISSNEWIKSFQLNSVELFQSFEQSQMTEISLLKFAIKQEIINLNDYFNWAKNHYSIPILKDDFFQKFPIAKSALDPKFWKTWSSTYDWSAERLPLCEWDNCIIIGCLEPILDLKLEVQGDKRLIWVLANPQKLETIWKKLHGISSKPSISAFNIKQEVPDEPIVAETKSQMPNSHPPVFGSKPSASENLSSQKKKSKGPTDWNNMSAEDLMNELQSLPDDSENSETNDESKIDTDSADNFDESSISNDNIEMPDGFSLDASSSQKSAENKLTELFNFENTPVSESKSNKITTPKLSPLQEKPKTELTATSKVASPASQSTGQSQTSDTQMASKSSSSVAKSTFKSDKPVSTQIHGKMPEQKTQTKTQNTFVSQKVAIPQTSIPESIGENTKLTAEKMAPPPPQYNSKPINSKINSGASKTSIFGTKTTTPSANGKARTLIEIVAGAYPEKFNQITNELFEKMKMHFNKSMILSLDEESQFAIPVAWDETFNTQGKNKIPLKDPSIFRIVSVTQKPFHGYVVNNSINEMFFNEWNKGEIPQHVTLVPIIANKKIVGMIMGFATELAFNNPTLQFTEESSNEYAEKVVKLSSSTAA